jgi:hypothetical protein
MLLLLLLLLLFKGTPALGERLWQQTSECLSKIPYGTLVS